MRALVLTSSRTHFESMHDYLKQINAAHNPGNFFESRQTFKSIINDPEDFEKICGSNLYDVLIVSMELGYEKQMMLLEKTAKAFSLPIIFISDVKRDLFEEAPEKESFLCFDNLYRLGLLFMDKGLVKY